MRSRTVGQERKKHPQFSRCPERYVLSVKIRVFNSGAREPSQGFQFAPSPSAGALKAHDDRKTRRLDAPLSPFKPL
ncbi:hypothetical protein [Polaromonas sp. CG9_12]|nr:hypothetical protein [Polaromonas sp. CG9_12]